MVLPSMIKLKKILSGTDVHYTTSNLVISRRRRRQDEKHTFVSFIVGTLQ